VSSLCPVERAGHPGTRLALVGHQCVANSYRRNVAPTRSAAICWGWIQVMLNDTIPAFRFNRPRTPSPLTLSPHRPASSQASNGPAAAKPASKPGKSDRTSAGAGSRDAVAADAERFLHQVRGSASQPLDSAGWLQRAGLNIRKASDAQHIEAIALAYATYIRISTSPLKSAIMAELEISSGRKRSRTTVVSPFEF